MKKVLFSLFLASLTSGNCDAQQTASSAIEPSRNASILQFNLGAQGQSQPVRWGIDTAWMWSWWPLRATNHMQECVTVGRVSIDPRWSGTYSSLSNEQKSHFDEQLSWLKKSGVQDLFIIAGNASGSAWSTSYRTTFINDLALAVKYLRGLGYNIIGISPFNEPDYGANRAPNASEMATVARMMRQNSTLSDIYVVGPSTLNPDYAVSWWSTMHNDIQIWNTHQLAGSFNNYVSVYETAQKNNMISAGDEMHNTGDALIAMNYGLQYGIWWSDYGGYTRAELGRASNDGKRIGYMQNEGTFTAAAVFRRDSQKMAEAFMGGSERQAGDQEYTFVSQDRLAYYDGHGPLYDYTSGTPGGTGYSAGQTNAESVIEITYGEDIPVGPLEGSFMIQNKATGNLLTLPSLASNTTITQSGYSSSKNQTWKLSPVTPEWDFAYSYIQCSKNTSLFLDALKYGGDNGARVLVYEGGGNECEKWHFRYMGNGWYTITNHDSGLSLEGSGDNSPNTKTEVVQWARTGSDRQLWRLIPAGAAVEYNAPATPTGLKAEVHSGSVTLRWTKNTEDDLLGYMVYRYNENAKDWELIGRQVKEAAFIDNICPKGVPLRYRLRAVDKSWNISQASAEVSIQPLAEKTIIASYLFKEDFNDISENHMDAKAFGTTLLDDGKHLAVSFNGTSDFLALPYHIADMQEMTFSAWIYPTSQTAWRRVFDFGRSTDNYMMFTISNGTRPAFEICKDGTKQTMTLNSRLSTGKWTHVAISISKDAVRIYINGTLDTESSSVTFRPADIRPNLSFIGRSLFASDPFFKGSLADITIHNYALSDEEVAMLCYHDKLTLAQELLNKPMYHETKALLLTALNDAHEAIKSGNTEAISASLGTLANATKDAEVSVKEYIILGEIIEWSQTLAETHPQSDTEALLTYESEMEIITGNYLQGKYPDTAIPQAATQARIITNKYQMSDPCKEATSRKAIDITHLLLNSDFEAGDTRYWDITTNEDTYNGVLRYNCLEFFNHTFTLQQNIPGMPSGKYRLQAQAFYRNGGKELAKSTVVNALLFIGETTSAIHPISKGADATTSSNGDWYAYDTSHKVPNDMEAAASAFNELNRYAPSATSSLVKESYYDATLGQPLSIGLKKDVAVNNDWTVVNYFKLLYMADPYSNMDEINDTPEDIDTGITYDITGRMVNIKPSSRGIFIHNGKKIIHNP